MNTIEQNKFMDAANKLLAHVKEYPTMTDLIKKYKEEYLKREGIDLTTIDVEDLCVELINITKGERDKITEFLKVVYPNEFEKIDIPQNEVYNILDDDE